MSGTIKNKAVVLLAAILLWGCDEQRDLYQISHPMLSIEGDWMPSLHRSNMAQNATAIAFACDGSCPKTYFYTPDNTITMKLSQDIEHVLVFNGMMFSAQSTHLDNIYFRGIETPADFEGCTQQGAEIKSLGRASDEVVASNEMEILTSAFHSEMITAGDGYYLKYQNGKGGFPTVEDYVKTRLQMTPIAVSYYAKLTVNLVNPRSAAASAAVVYGFSGSVYMASRMPSHAYVVHHLPLNNLKITKPATTPESGTIESHEFVTFGPPLDLPDHAYKVRVRILLKDNTTVDETFDVTEQIEPVITRIKANLGQSYPAETDITIPITVSLTLPVVADKTTVDINDWDEETIIFKPTL